MGRLGVAVRTTLEPTVAPGIPSLIFSALLPRGSQYPFLPFQASSSDHVSMQGRILCSASEFCISLQYLVHCAAQIHPRATPWTWSPTRAALPKLLNSKPYSLRP